MMKTKLTYRALALLLTAALLLTSVVSLSSMIASAEFAADITTQQSDAGGSSDTTTEPSTQPQSGTTGQQTEESTDTTTQTETSAQPSTEPAQPSTTSPAVVSGGGKTQPSTRPQVNAGGGTVAVPQAVTWLGVDGTTNNMGSASNPYAVSSLQHFLEIQDKINVSGNSNKNFRLTVDINLSTLSISNFFEYAGFAASLVCISPALAASYPTQVFFNLDGDGHRIYGLNVTNSGKDTTAIFGYVSANSVISNVAFEDCTLNVEYASAKVCAIVAVQNMGTIQGCSFKNLTLSMNSAQGDGSTSETYQFSGGHIVQVGYAAVAGDNQGTITDSYLVDTTVRVWLRRFVGAVSGQNKGQITNLNGSGIVLRYFRFNDDRGPVRRFLVYRRDRRQKPYRRVYYRLHRQPARHRQCQFLYIRHLCRRRGRHQRRFHHQLLYQGQSEKQRDRNRFALQFQRIWRFAIHICHIRRCRGH